MEPFNFTALNLVVFQIFCQPHSYEGRLITSVSIQARAGIDYFHP